MSKQFLILSIILIATVLFASYVITKEQGKRNLGELENELERLEQEKDDLTFLILEDAHEQGYNAVYFAPETFKLLDERIAEVKKLLNN